MVSCRTDLIRCRCRKADRDRVLCRAQSLMLGTFFCRVRTLPRTFKKNIQYYKFCLYGFLKNLKFFEPFLVLFFLEKGLTFFQIGILYAVREIATNILEIPSGIAADVAGRRKTMICAFLFYIFSFLVFYCSAAFFLFVPAMVLFAFGEACRTGTHKAMIFEYLKILGWTDQKVHYYGHTRSWSQIGSAVSALISAGIVFYSGSYSSIFLYATVPYFLALLLMVTYPRELDGVGRHLSGSEIRQNFVRVARASIETFTDSRTLRAVSNLSVFSALHRASKDYLQPMLSAFALSMPFFLYFEDRQRSALVIGMVYTLIYLLTTVSARRSGRMAERFDHIIVPLNRTLVLGLMMGVLTGLFYRFEITILSVLLYVGLYIVQNLRKPMGIAYVSDIVKHDILATALSAESQVTTLFTAVLAVVTGFLADRFGIGNALIIVCSVLLVAFPLYRAKEQ